MDHKQSATPFGRRARLLCPNWSNCSTVEPAQKALFKKRLPFALDARAGAFPAQLTQITILKTSRTVSCSRRARRQQSLARSGSDWAKQIRFVVLSI